MVKEAEANKDADKKKRETVDVRNQADSIIHTTEKSLKEHGDNLPVMKSIKRTIDPNNIMNPGKIFDLN